MEDEMSLFFRKAAFYFLMSIKREWFAQEQEK
jgi:hypothetical protein